MRSQESAANKGDLKELSVSSKESVVESNANEAIETNSVEEAEVLLFFVHVVEEERVLFSHVFVVEETSKLLILDGELTNFLLLCTS